MKIKRLQITGFKSFVDRTTITFPDPITAVVGPNGCGKSNIVDAIRWVMGEQSAKHLRGKAMDDVIFTGSETRGPAGLAEVSLTFDAHAMPGDAAPGGVPWGAVGPAEVVVTRRLYREGESEYLLGGVPCRLRDVVDFFLGTGVGTKAYSIIEQGRIGFIVSSRAEDRRNLIDEAAGITKYKAKKKIAERKMEATRQHLLRVSDIIGEIETRLRSLRLQAQKAERYKRYKTELRDIELWSASQRFLGFLAEEKTVRASLDEVSLRHDADASALSADETAVEAERLALTEEMNELTQARDELYELSHKADLGTQRAQYKDQEAGELDVRAVNARREIEDLAARAAENAAALAGLEADLARLQQEAADRRGAYEELDARHAAAREELVSTRGRLDQSLASAAAGVARMARFESDVESGTRQLDDLHRRLDAAVADGERLAADSDLLAAEADAMSGRVTEIGTRRADTKLRRVDLEARAGELRTIVARGEIELETLREESHRRRSRLQSLGEIQSRYESFQRGVRAIMKQYREQGQDTVGEHKAWSPDTAIRGLVADIVQPPPDLEAAVEAVLGDRLGNIIVESHDVGVDAIQFLKARSEGRSSFIPLSLRDRPMAQAAAGAGTVVYDASGGASVEPAPMVPMVAAWPSGEGVRGPILELIGYDRRYDKVATHLLGDVLVVENLHRALDLWRETKTDKTIVTLDGEVIDPQGVVTGGSRESAVAGILSQKREVRELEEVVAQLEKDYQAALGKHIAVKQALAEATAAQDSLNTIAREEEVAEVSQRKDLERVSRERQQIEVRRLQLAHAERELREGLARAENRLESARSSLVSERELVVGAETQGAALRSEVSGLTDRLDALIDQLTDAKIAAASADERRNTALATQGRLVREGGEGDARRERLVVTAAEDAARAGALRAEATALSAEAELWHAEAEERARVHGERQSLVEERGGALARHEAELKAARSSVAVLAQELSDLLLRRQEVSLKRTSLDEHIAGRYQDIASLADVITDHHLRPPVGPAEEERMGELRGLIERMGEINLTAIEESNELQQRFDFLTGQKTDLEQAIAQLEAAIEKINRTSKKRFREVFDAVNEKFREVFPRLFGGGRANLALSDENDLLETGIEIVANPPGKKIMQNIELLSGGEKALTAVSLLFAIFLVKPSPFCLLDEVDAPLDDANVGRFNQMVREMTDRSQFIIITHNRRTMEIADRLCGITMEEAGVSKLVAVNLRGPRVARVDAGAQGEPTSEAAAAALESA